MNINKSFERIGNDVRARRNQAIDALLRRMDLQPRQSAVKPLLWLAVGVIVGGGLMVLLAPESGREVRERLIKLAKDAKERIPIREASQPAAPVTH